MSSNDQLKQAVVDSVEHGAYPDPQVSSAELPAALLPALLADLQKARHEVKVASTPSFTRAQPSDPVDADRHT